MHLSNLPTSGLAVAVCLTLPATAQTTFSIDYKGPTISIPSPTGITEGDILAPAGGFPALGPTPPPVIVIAGGPGLALPAWPGCVGHAPGVACGVEVDALSYGMDQQFVPGMPPGSIKFSVGRFPTGIPGPGPVPSVFSEGPIGEAPADVFVDSGTAPWPCGAVGIAVPGANAGLFDGDGLPFPSPFTYPGLGLVEPAFGGCLLPDPGDNVDALDADGPIGPRIYFSLDSAFADVPCAFPLGGSALINGGFSGADILTPTGFGLAVWAPAGLLGLDLFGPGQDDLDALAILENGNGTPDVGPCASWGGASDMILFSVRNGSAIVGVVDPVSGLPIQPGDILTPPLVAGTPPTIFIAAELLGLTSARTSATMDELDGLDITKPLFDCNGNGVEDVVDVATLFDTDCNGNLQPDSCESPVSYCTPGTSASGCTATLSSLGTASATATTGFVVTATTVEGNKNGIFFYGQNGRQANPWGNGTSYQCVVPPVKRGGLQTGSGTIGLCDGTFSQDLNARWCPTCPNPAQAPIPGVPMQIQLWYRDPLNTSNQTTSLSDALEVIPCP